MDALYKHAGMMAPVAKPTTAERIPSPCRELLVQQDDAVRPPAQQRERVVAVRGLGHGEPLLLEEPAVGLETLDFVVDPEDRLGARHRRGS